MAKRSNHYIDAHVGARVRLRRMMMGMSQERLGELLGVTFQQIQKYEKGANRIGASRLYEVSQVLDVPLQYFFEDLPSSDEKPIARPHGTQSTGTDEPFLMDFVARPEGLALNKAYLKIKDPKMRRPVLDLLQALAGEKVANKDEM